MIPRHILQTFALALLVANLCSADKVSYDGHTLLRLRPQTKDHLSTLQKLLEDERNEEISFWSEPKHVNGTVDIMVAPEAQDGFYERLQTWRIPSTRLMHNVGDVIRRSNRPAKVAKWRDSFNSSLEKSASSNTDVFFTQYQSYADIEKKLSELGADPRVTVETAGYSYEKRKLYLVKLSTDPSANKPVIFIDGLHHAREWIAASTAMYIMTSLVNNEDPERALNSRDGRRISDTDAKKDLRNSVADALSKFDFWFVPVVNPDGYEYARTNDRLWRKTRSRSGLCTGVDPNRNYAYHWRESGASSISCSEVYAGPHALSEPETKVIARILKKNGNRIAMYLTLHSYSQLFLAPYGYAQIYPDNYAEMSRVASEGMQAIASLHGTHYRFGPSAIVLYAAAGGSDDYAHGVANIKLSYTIELPDEGRYGFLLPADRIIPVGREILAGVTAMTRAI